MKVKNALPVLFGILLLLIWEYVPVVFDVPKYLLPRFSEVIGSLVDNKETVRINLSITAYEAFIGFLFGSSLGFLFGVVVAESRVIRDVISPYLIGVNAIPIIALAPLIIIWFGSGVTSKVIMAAFLCFFPVTVNTIKGLTNRPRVFERLFMVYGASRYEFLVKFKIINALPFIFSGLKLSATYASIGAIVAEFTGADKGIGFAILRASYNLDSPRLWGYILLAGLLGLSFYGLVSLVERFTPKHFRHGTSV
ncbi:MAG TPA: hypothetical protein DCR93_20650 [Cytophagales bacterium]|nr:hypothetical protein [Cytophagales bacterium]HAP61803.1 hypothetical protein [Cytophagales bacterium]